ncbi:arsenate reductase ArsC [Legionella jamestowniensis]|uniref:Phosphotyrosine protein phosphatase n=1 Tax=Legionella jamestowniensis TaxID=455 RepID=A0A0W0UKQ9_9GAMM|nr:arsenate reductase ArsC [Legionella jamestowniensis]KTD08332.1 Protein ArsC [Legionella jamestowniensis]OCH97143.1 phosphotyrosine protein phosphatase [Legionella jamestowniensis]SFL49860.1 arsenate reductase [Legionella jamestowniensis DSM 19215]
MTNRQPIKLLFLCTGNSCRSIMAEAMLNHYASNHYLAFSAGSAPVNHVHPKAIETLERHAIKANTSRSKSWEEFKSQTFDVVITVCDKAASESCPIFPGHPTKLHWSIPDPAQTQGSKEEINAAFETVFHQLKLKIEQELLS